MLDWVESKRSKILSVLQHADPDAFDGTTIEAVGLCLMKHWDDDWDAEFLRDVHNNNLALLIWTRYSTWWLGTRGDGTRHLDWEVAGRIGAIAKGQGWIEKNRRALERATKRLRVVKKIQEA
jgi:hypothetical protein